MYFSFREILFFIPLILAGIIIFFIYISKVRQNRLEQFMDKNLIAKHMDPLTRIYQDWKILFFILAFAFLFLGLARPQWGEKMENVTRRGLDIILAVDTSYSMLAEDFKPNRMDKAKHEISTFIDTLKGDRVGIITFAGTSFLQCPLTLDYDAVKMYLDLIECGSIPVPGTAIAKAIQKSIKAFDQAEYKHKVLILITDGEDNEGKPVEAAKDAKKNGIVIYTIGIGSVEGEPIPLRDENNNLIGYKKDRKGNVIMSKLNEIDLEKIALVTGGKYFHATASEMELNRIYDEINKMEKKNLGSSLYNKYEDKYEWFLVPALILLMLEMFFPERSFASVFTRKKEEE